MLAQTDLEFGFDAGKSIHILTLFVLAFDSYEKINENKISSLAGRIHATFTGLRQSDTKFRDIR
jgi:hypothetical protein